MDKPLLQNLTRLPGLKDDPYVADWAELICLTSADGQITESDLAERIEMQEEYEPVDGQDAESTVSSSREDEEREASQEVESVADRKDRFGRAAASAFEHLEARYMSYGDSYPFDIKSNGKKLVLREASAARDLYLFLLACASFRYVPDKKAQQNFAGVFELVCTLAMKSRLPKEAEVHLFGKNSLVPEGVFQATKLFDKVNALCEKLGGRLSVDETDFRPRNTGDRGLDIVGWFRSGDDIGSKLTFFAQCACTHEWVSKQHSCGDDAWGNITQLISRPSPVCYVPFDFRRVDRSWLWPADISRTHMIDRFRLMYDLGFQTDDVTVATQESLARWLPKQRLDACRGIELDGDI